jgi:hypothetical protein
VPASIDFEKLNHFEASQRIQATGGFIQKKYLRRGNKLTSDTNSTFLSSADALLDRRAYGRISLARKTEAV